MCKEYFFDANYDEAELSETVKKRPAMFFGSRGLAGLHHAILDLVEFCVISQRQNISITLEGSHITLEHDGEMLPSCWVTTVIQSACEVFTYRNNRYQFTFDQGLFEKTQPNRDALLDSLRELAFLNSPVNIRFHDYPLCYKNGLFDLYEYLHVKSGLAWHSWHTPIGFGAKEDTCEFTVVFSDVCSPYPCTYSYVNNHRTKEDGVHVDGFLSGLKEALGPYTHLSCGHKEEINYFDVALVMHIKTSNPQFCGTEKRKLMNPEIYRSVVEATKENLSAIFRENPAIPLRFVQCFRCQVDQK